MQHSPALSVEILHLQKYLGIIDSQALEKETKKALLPSLKNFGVEALNLACSIKDEYNFRLKIEKNELDIKKLRTPKDSAALFCLDASDERLTSQVLKIARKSKSSEDITFSLLALLKLPGFNDEKIQFAKTALGTAENSLYAKWVILSATPPEKRKEKAATLGMTSEELLTFSLL
jgi:hypothetical protein